MVEKEGLLVECIRLQYVKFCMRNEVQCGQAYLPKSLFDKPLLGSFFRDFAAFSNFFMAAMPFQ